MFSSEPALTSANRSKHALKIKGIVFVTHKQNLNKKAGVKFYFNLKEEIIFSPPQSIYCHCLFSHKIIK